MSLEMFEKRTEAIDLQQMLTFGRRIDRLVLQHPRVGMMHQDGMETCGQSRVDVGARAVAYHPRVACAEGVARANVGVCSGILLVGDLHCDEKTCNA